MRILIVALVLAGLGTPPATAKRREDESRFLATAFVRRGRTALGTHPRPGTVAADPSVLPLGTRIRVTASGGRSGTYVVTDTGVHGRHIDIFMSSRAAARQFGKQWVKVRVLR